MDSARDDERPLAPLLAVGAVAGRLGVAPETVRSWERRYGVGPTGRTLGGHRRYNDEDLAVLFAMQDLVGAGVRPADAARQAVSAAPARRPAGPSPGLTRVPPAARRPGGPGGRTLSIPDAGPRLRGLARIVSRLDSDAIMGNLSDHLVEHGVQETWTELLLPLLTAVGAQWSRTNANVDVERVLSEAVLDALRAYRVFLPRPMPGAPVLLACTGEDEHTITLHAVAAGLTERRIPFRMLGARVPTEALASAAKRTAARGVFLWRQVAEPADAGALFPGALTRNSAPVVVGGRGWDGVELPPTATRAFDLDGALERLSAGQ